MFNTKIDLTRQAEIRTGTTFTSDGSISIRENFILTDIPIISTGGTTGDVMTFDGAVIRLSANTGSGGGSEAYPPIDPPDWNFAPMVPDFKNEALDYLADALNRLLPQQALTLNSQNISLRNASNNNSQIPTFSGFLPGGLTSTTWYSVAITGANISNVIYTNTFDVRHVTGSTLTQFRAGTNNGIPPTYGADGLVIALQGGVEISGDSRELSAGTGQTGRLEILTIDPFGAGDFWVAARARIRVTSQQEGYDTYAIRRISSGLDTSNSFGFYYDDNTIPPSLALPVGFSLTFNSSPGKWLSGERYATLDDTITFTGGTFNNLFNKVYVANPIRALLTGLLTASQNIGAGELAAAPILFDDVGDINTVTRNLNASDQAAYNPTMIISAFKPNTTTTLGTVNFRTQTGFGISTYGIESTPTVEPFQDEDKRFFTGSGTTISTTPFISTNTPLATNELTVRPGQLLYVGTTGDRYYERDFSKTTVNGTITFFGLSNVNTDINTVISGTGLRVLLLLKNDNLYFDLAKPFSPSDPSAGTFADPYGGKDVGSGNVLSWTIGTKSIVANGNEYRLIIIMDETVSDIIINITTT